VNTVLNILFDELQSYITVHSRTGEFTTISTIERKILMSEFLLKELPKIIERLDLDYGGGYYE
jgi:hypothetical protein